MPSPYLAHMRMVQRRLAGPVATQARLRWATWARAAGDRDATARTDANGDNEKASACT